MKFCTISPIKGLKQYGNYLSNHHLVLANWLHNEEYMKYYSTRMQAGDHVILDNGAYENTKPLDAQAYFNWIKNLAPQVVVLPDFLLAPWRKTTAASLKFLDEFSDQPSLRNYRTEWMFCPQTTPDELDGLYRSIDTVVNDGRQGHKITWLGLGRYIAAKFGTTYNHKDPGWTFRCEMAMWAKKNFPHLKIHALGMNAGDVRELKHLAQLKVTSIDSSCAVWRGWNGWSLEESDWEKVGTPCDFGAEATQNNVTIIANLEVIRNAIG